MKNPFELLNVTENATDEEVRQAYLRLIQRYNPEHFPAEFKAIKAASEKIRGLKDRLAYLLLECHEPLNFDTIIEEYTCLMKDKPITRTKLTQTCRQLLQHHLTNGGYLRDKPR
jgi:curved DNA-binding protein CbpA